MIQVDMYHASPLLAMKDEGIVATALQALNTVRGRDSVYASTVTQRWECTKIMFHVPPQPMTLIHALACPKGLDVAVTSVRTSIQR